MKKDAMLVVRIESETLERFKAKCDELQVKYSHVISDFLNEFLNGKKKPSNQDIAIPQEMLDNRITECITSYLDNELEQRLSNSLDKMLDNRITECITNYMDNHLEQSINQENQLDLFTPQNELKLEQVEDKGTITPEKENDGVVAQSGGAELENEKVELDQEIQEIIERPLDEKEELDQEIIERPLNEKEELDQEAIERPLNEKEESKGRVVNPDLFKAIDSECANDNQVAKKLMESKILTVKGKETWQATQVKSYRQKYCTSR